MAKRRITLFLDENDISFLFELAGFLTQTEKKKFTPSNIVHLMAKFFREIARELKIELYDVDNDYERDLIKKILNKLVM